MTTSASRPWYRQPWPWLLMAGPAIVIVAGIVTTVIAVRTSDGMVADDYYKQGLGINRTLARDAKAGALRAKAEVQFNEERTRVRLRLTGDTQPARLGMTLVHPTRAGGDQSIVLTHGGGGFYEGGIAAPHPGAWRLRIEDAEGGWRLTGVWNTRDGTVRLEPAG
jgi:hypothetical protein